jgi:hypothetical protein
MPYTIGPDTELVPFDSTTWDEMNEEPEECDIDIYQMIFS